jgi:signal transduction histidine kinase
MPVDTAVASLTHELKNPLTAVKALVQLLRQGDASVGTRERLDEVLAEVQHMEAVLRGRRDTTSTAPQQDERR